MHARILVIETLPEELDTAIDLYRLIVVPAAQRQRGFRGLFFLTDRATGAVRSITLWEGPEDNFDEGTYQYILSSFNDRVTIKSFTRDAYEVSVRA
jgi:hypothetical protein